MLKKIVSLLPSEMQDDLKRRRFRRQIRNGNFICDEPEIHLITRIVESGDWIIDVGANVGHYTCHLAKCVGEKGRVIAIEPVPDTFSILAANVRTLGSNNITLINMAASDSPGIVHMDVPHFGSGLVNFYRASISNSGRYAVMSMPIDYFQLGHKISLIKIDAENHDLEVLRGAEKLIDRDSPILIVEGSEQSSLGDWLRSHEYRLARVNGSPNMVATKDQATFGHLEVIAKGNVTIY